MATKDISDALLCEAAVSGHYGLNFLHELTGQHWKVCLRALERGYKRDIITCGSHGGAMICPKGEALLIEHRRMQSQEERDAIAAAILRMNQQRQLEREASAENQRNTLEAWKNIGNLTMPARVLSLKDDCQQADEPTYTRP